MTDDEYLAVHAITVKLDELRATKKRIDVVAYFLKCHCGQLNQYIVQPENQNTYEEWDKTQGLIAKCQDELFILYQKEKSLNLFFSAYSSDSVEKTMLGISAFSKCVTAASKKMADIESRIAQIDAEMKNDMADSKRAQILELAKQKEELRTDFTKIKLVRNFYSKSVLALFLSESFDADIRETGVGANAEHTYADRFAYVDCNTGGLTVE